MGNPDPKTRPEHGYRLISADSHVNEPPDLWTKRVPQALRDRAPRIERFEQGDAWRIVADCCGERWCNRHDQPAELAEAFRRLSKGRPEDPPANDAYRPETAFAPLVRLLAARHGLRSP